MNSLNRSLAPAGTAELLGYAIRKGVRFWSDSGKLRYRAPKGALTPGDIERLTTSRDEIVSLLERAGKVGTAESQSDLHPRLDRAPLAYSQLQHWNLYQLHERYATRHIAAARRLRGRLSVDALERSIASLVCRHDALRTRIVILGDGPTQEIHRSGGSELEVRDLTEIPEYRREIEVNDEIKELILDPIDVSLGPLFGVRLLRLSDIEHILVIATEHIVSDMSSLSLMFRDLFAAYVQAMTGRPSSLPPIPVQFTDYAIWQHATQGAWLEEHGMYWKERLNSWRRVRFPMDKGRPSTEAKCVWNAISVMIDGRLIEELRAWALLRRTTLVMSVFTAYVALVLRWCSVSEAVIQYQTDGRGASGIENTIGYFASVLYLHVEIFPDDTFADLLNRVTEEYCRAYEHADSCYLQVHRPKPDFTRSTCFNWVPEVAEVDLSELAGSPDALSSAPVPIENPALKHLEIDAEPFVVVFEGDNNSVCRVHFPVNRFTVGGMERFGRNFIAFLGGLLTRPDVPVKEMALVQ